MLERRRHQRVRCAQSLALRIGHAGAQGVGVLENLSASGLMMRSALPLRVGQDFGLSFAFNWSPLVETGATAVSRVGDLVGVRFNAGPLTVGHLSECIAEALRRGEASTAAVHESNGRKVLKVAGGLSESLLGDLRHFVERVGVDDLDAGEVTYVSPAAMAVFVEPLRQGRLQLLRASLAFSDYLDTLP